MKTASGMQVREYNQNLVRRELMRLRLATKAQLASATGLSQMTVGTAVSWLVQRGEAEEGRTVPSNGGRPSTEYRYKGDFRKAVTLHTFQKYGQNCVQLGVYDLLGECLYQDSCLLEAVHIDSFDRMLGKAFELAENIGVIGLGLPALAADGEVLSTDHPALAGKKLFRRYETLFHVPVLFVNDVNAAAAGYALRSGSGGDTIAALYFPERYPPGMGLIIDGKLHTGRRNFVGEVQYLPIGVNWNAMDYKNEKMVINAVVKLLTAVCSIAAPNRFVLYGDFFRSEMAQIIQAQVEENFRGKYGLQLELSSGLEEDYREGMAALSLQTLKDTLFGKFGPEPAFCGAGIVEE